MITITIISVTKAGQTPFRHKCWEQTWKLLSGARQGLSFHPHQEQSNDLRSVLNFVLTVGIVLMQDLADERFAINVWEAIRHEFMRNDLVNHDFFRQLIPLYVSAFYQIRKGESDEGKLSANIFALIDIFDDYPEIAYNTLTFLYDNFPSLKEKFIHDYDLSTRSYAICKKMQEHIENKGKKRVSFHRSQNERCVKIMKEISSGTVQ